MSPANLICAGCRLANPPDARYCYYCGQPVAPALLQELSQRYEILQSLDRAIADGQGQISVREFRESLFKTYQDLRAARPVRQAPTAAQPEPAPSAATSDSLATQATQTSDIAAEPPLREPLDAAPRPTPGPVFSWRAFIADQAIAVMAYLGGFLLLIATLTFEVSGWNQLSNAAKLVGVTVVYLLFGALGLGLRRVTSLSAVGRVYLGVFALMTPLEALAAYRFYLQAQGFPLAGMVCLASLYTAAVYLALGARTRFATYAYLGWAAALAGVIAIPEWANAAGGWWLAALSLAAAALLLPHELGRRQPDGLMAWLATPALWISGLAAIAATPVAVVLFFGALGSVFGSTTGRLALAPGTRLALAVTFVALVALALGWRSVLRAPGWATPWQILTTLAASAAALAVAACAAFALAFNAGGDITSYTLALASLLCGIVLTLLARALASERGVVASVRIVAMSGSALALLFGAVYPTPNYPQIVACAAGLALALLYALTAPIAATVWWGLIGGLFAVIGAQPVFAASVPSATLLSLSDSFPGAALQLPSLYAEFALALMAVGLGLRFATPAGSRGRQLRYALYATALLNGLITLLSFPGHSRLYMALLVGALSAAALLCGRIERQPVAFGIPVGFFGSLAVIGTISLAEPRPDLAATIIAPTVALAALVIYSSVGRAYALPVYIAAFLGACAAVNHPLMAPPGPLADFTLATFGLSGLSALLVATLIAIAALRERGWHWQIWPALLSFLCVFTANELWPAVVLTLALASVGALSRAWRSQNWGAPWQGAAFLTSIVALFIAARGPNGDPTNTLIVALIFLIVAWLVSWQNGSAWWTIAIAPYAVAAYYETGGLPLHLLPKLGITVGLTLALAAVGGLARGTVGRRWALALYGAAIYGSLVTIEGFIVASGPAGLLEATLLVYAACAFLIALVEDKPLAALAPALYATAAAFVQPDGRALLPLALGLAVAAYAISRTKGAYWALPLYGAALLAAADSAWQSQSVPGFQSLALLILAVAAWIIAALESRAEALLIAYLFAWLAIPSAGHAFGWDSAAVTLLFAALAWIVALSEFAWAALPGLRERASFWQIVTAEANGWEATWRDSRVAGRRIARVAGLFIALLAAVSGMFAPNAFATGAVQTQAVAVALFSLAFLLFAESRLADWRLAAYLAGEALALCVTWELRWLGLDNVQAWIIAPGSAQIIIGALLPADKRLNAPPWLGQAFSVAGALVLTLPTLAQSITEPQEWQWAYALTLALEALLLTLIGVGLRNRLLALTGSAFVGVAAIRGAIIAISQNLPAPIIIALLALILLGLATWLSWRARPDSENAAGPGAGG